MTMFSFNLSPDFIDTYRNKTAPFGFRDAGNNSVGEITFLRTYSRLKEDGSKETWVDVCERVINGMYSIQKDHCKTNRLPWNDNKAQHSAQDAFERLFNLKWSPPGRGLWMMGTPLVMNDRNSAALQNCFAGETEFITMDGVKKLGDVAGTVQTILTEGGAWVEAPIRSFGVQPLMKVTLTRQGREKVIYATPEHRWFAVKGKGRGKENYREVYTQDLDETMRLQEIFGQGIKGSVTPSPFGIAHGFTYGDGRASIGNRNSNSVSLFGNKDKAVAKYFELCPPRNITAGGGGTEYGALPNYFKKLPELTENKSYLYGWLAGYFAADGSVTPAGQVALTSNRRSDLEFVREVCYSLGIGTYDIRTQRHTSNLDGKEYDRHEVCFMRDTLTEDFFIIDEHRKRWLQNPTKSRSHWWVKSVETTERVEEVFCATVPKYGKFALTDNILTGNCSFVSTNEMTKNDPAKPFAFLMEASMLGIGVGFDDKGADKGFTIYSPEKMPPFNYIVPDTREGWVESVRILINSYLRPDQNPIEFDYSQIRPAGVPIKTFGGTAAGPEPLEKLHNTIRDMFKGREGQEFTRTDIADLGNLIGVCVVSGNVRRSAELLMGRLDDDTFINLKNYGEWDEDGNFTPGPAAHRKDWGWMSNNSVEVSVGDDMSHIIDAIALNGEPGVIWMDVTRKYGRLIDPPTNADWRAAGYNPCAEQSLESGECCVSGETKIQTREGLFPILDLVGKKVDVWNGEEWSQVEPFFTGKNDLYRVAFSDGSYLDATPKHEWSVRSGRGWKKVHTDMLKVGDILPEFALNQVDGKRCEDAYRWGWFVGDGYVDSGRDAIAIVQEHELAVVSGALAGRERSTRFDYRTGTPWIPVVLNDYMSVEDAKLMRTQDMLHPDILTWDTESISEFFGGWIDTDGSLIRNPNTDHYVLYGSEGKLRDAQILLRRIGINHATLRKFASKGDVTNLGVRNQDLYRLLIPSYEASAIKTQLKQAKRFGSRLRNNNAHSGSIIDAARKQKIVSIELVASNADTYCFTEPKKGMGVFGNVLTYQCTLVETYLNRHESLEDFKKTLKAAYLYGKSVTLLPTHWSETNAIMQRNRRIGTSVSGIANFADNHSMIELRSWLDQGYEVVRGYDKVYSEWLGIRESVKVTTVKPSGCRPWNALTTTENGVLTLEEIFADSGHRVGEEWHDVEIPNNALQGGSHSAITKTYDNGEAEVFSVRMSYGMEVRSTGNHQWFVKERYDRSATNRRVPIEAWVPAEFLRPGDVLDIQLGLYQSSREQTFKYLDSLAISMRQDAQEITQPEAMTPDIAWFLGYLWGDGAMSPSKYRIRFVDANVDNLEKAKRILSDVFAVEASIHQASGHRKAYTLDVGNKTLWHWLIKNDVWKYTTDNRIDVIPEVVRRSSTHSVIAFLAGLIDADGCVVPRDNERTVTLASADEDFARHVQDVAASVGVLFGRSHNTRGSNLQQSKSMWLMQMGPDTLPTSVAVLSQYSEKMRNHAGTLPWSPERRNTSRTRILGKVESVESLGFDATYDIEVADTHWYYAGAVKSHNTVSILAGESPGVHWSPGGEYFLRGIVFQKDDPMVKVFKEAGYKVHKSVYTPETSVYVQFPIHSPAKRSEKDVTIFEKANLAALAQRYWSDNSVSVTLSFDKENEGHHVGTVLHMYDGQLKTVSFLPMGNMTYEQMPYTQITEAEYNKYISKLQPIDLSGIYKGNAMDASGEAYCTTDACEMPQR